MPMSYGFHSPRQILVLFLGTTLVLLVGLGWFGLRSFERDRAVTAQRVRDQLDNSADLIAAEIRQSLAETEERLTRLSLLPADAVQDAAREYAKGLGQDALVMVFEPEAVRAYPAGRLLYFPALAVAEDLSTQPFATGEMLDFDYKPSFVDGMGSPMVFPAMWELARSLLEGSLVVSLKNTAEAVKLLIENNNVIAEGAGAATVAAAIHNEIGAKKIVCVISGGNIDTEKIIKILQDIVP